MFNISAFHIIVRRVWIFCEVRDGIDVYHGKPGFCLLIVEHILTEKDGLSLDGCDHKVPTANSQQLHRQPAVADHFHADVSGATAAAHKIQET